ncbi:hypothetical protein [Bacillus clarus]|uniref:hypothetical protein n=1 Tax=Bacillus clarus TaxID=2338372 RepID=UPI000A3FC641|nr:hypothetical protein [Bacillus clarus]
MREGERFCSLFLFEKTGICEWNEVNDKERTKSDFFSGFKTCCSGNKDLKNI